VLYYDKLQNTVGGGKPKMKYYFKEDAKNWPLWKEPGNGDPMPAPFTKEAQDELVDRLQDVKTEYYKILLEEVATPRPGIIELMDEAIKDPRIKVGVCSAATKAGFIKVVDTLLGADRLAALDVILAGDDVSEKKPSPLIYNTARDIINIPADRCVVIEDSLVGLKAAKAAGMRCIITYTESTKGVDFYREGADAKLPDLGKVQLADIFDPLRNLTPQQLKEDFLSLFKDPILADSTTTTSTTDTSTTTSTSDTSTTTTSTTNTVITSVYKGWTPHLMTMFRA